MNTKPKSNPLSSSIECFQAPSLTAASLSSSRNTWNSCSVQLLRDASSNLRLAAPKGGVAMTRLKPAGPAMPTSMPGANGTYSSGQLCAEASLGQVVSASTPSSLMKAPSSTPFNTGKVLVGSKHTSLRTLTPQELWEQKLVLPTPVQDRHTEPFHVKSTTKSMLLYAASVLILIATLHLSNL